MAPIPANSDVWDDFVNSAPSTDNNSLQNLSDEDGSSDPFKTWIYVPLIVFMLIALAIVIIQFRRRRRKIVNNLMLRQALARDIEALGPDPNNPATQRIYIVRTGPDGQPREVVPAAGRRARSGGLGLRPSRWQWSLPTTGPRRSPEEGLNELGEAPPPYDASKDPPIPLDEIRQTSETLSRISEEEPRNPAAGQQEGTAQRAESTRTSTTNFDNNTTTNATGTGNTTVASSSVPATSVTGNKPASEPSAPPPAYMRYA